MGTIFTDKMKKSIFLLLALVACCRAAAQEATSTYNVLKLPVSSHAAALGGDNVSLIEDSPWAGWANPALYASVSDGSLGLDFMSYVGGGSWMGAQYVKAFGQRHTAALTAQYMNYGSIDETTETGEVIGDFSPKDIVFGGAYSYLLSDRWSGGAALKAVSSSYGGYNAFALSFDLGVNYFDEATDVSVSAVARNVGAQLKGFDGRTEHLPFSMEVGLSKGMAHVPVRFSVTLTDLTRWSSADYYRAAGEKLSPGRLLTNHLVVGVDLVPSDLFYVCVGYNFRRAYELKSAGSSHGAGLTVGAGLHVKRFSLGAAYAKYHVSASSLLFNVGYQL